MYSFSNIVRLTGDGSKGETVSERESGREEERRVGLVLLFIKVGAVGDDARNLVGRAGVVERVGRRDGHVLGIPSVGVVESRRNDP